MVNKAALSVLGVIVLVSMGVGILIGMQLGGPSNTQTGGNSSGGGGVTPIPTDSPAATTGNGTPTPLPTATSPGGIPTDGSTTTTERPPQQRTTMLPRRFNEREIEQLIADQINAERQSSGKDTLATDGNLAERIRVMSRNHSVQMADAGRVSHLIDGVTSKDRYQRASLYDTCKFLSNSGNYIIDAEGNNFETVAMVKAGRQYERNGETRYHDEEADVADAIVEEWFSNQFLKPRLMYDNAETMAVGIEITQNGEVYATTNVC